MLSQCQCHDPIIDGGILQELRVFSEFSGYGTAEIAAEGIVHQCCQQGYSIRISHCSGADKSKSCRKILSSSSQMLRLLNLVVCVFSVSQVAPWIQPSLGPQSCLFGDILNLLPDNVCQQLGLGDNQHLSPDTRPACFAVSRVSDFGFGEPFEPLFPWLVFLGFHDCGLCVDRRGAGCYLVPRSSD